MSVQASTESTVFMTNVSVLLHYPLAIITALYSSNLTWNTGQPAIFVCFGGTYKICYATVSACFAVRCAIMCKLFTLVVGFYR